MDNKDIPPPVRLPIQFQLLYNWEASAVHDAVRNLKTPMYPAFKCELHGVPIYCLIDHSLEQHYISAAQLWKACGLTVTEGLFLFELKISDYQVDFLLPYFPFCDVWVSVPHAKRMASILGVESELGALWQLDGVFSSDNDARNELVHNWRIESIPNTVYSTRALLETPFDQLELLSGNRKIRTQVSRSRQTGMVCRDRLETGLLRWAIWAYEEFLRQRDKQAVSAAEEDHDLSDGQDRDNVANAVWDVMQGLLCDLQTVERQSAERNLKSFRVLSDSMMVGNMPLKREYLQQGRLLQNVYISVMVEKLFNAIQMIPHPTIEPADEQGNYYNRNIRTGPSEAVAAASEEKAKERDDKTADVNATRPPESTRHVSNTSLATSPTDMSNMAVDTNIMLHDRMDFLEQEMYRLRRKGKKKSDNAMQQIMELEVRLATLESWKTRTETSRRSERVWVLMFTISVLIVFWMFGPR